MKKNILTLLLFMCCGVKVLHAQVGMNTNSPDKSAVLDMTGTTNKGLLLPNVSLVALDNPAPIVNNAPATGLMIYNNNAALPALNGQPGGLGFYYWDGAKWCRVLISSEVIADNLGNHTATDTLNMSNNNINNVNKLTTQTEAIAMGTDSVLPQAGNIAMSADNAGNTVWRTPPHTIATDNFSFCKKSTGTALTGFQTWTDIPGLSNFTYTAPATGTLVLQSVIYGRADPNFTAYPNFPGANNLFVLLTVAVRLQVFNGATLVDQNCSTITNKVYNSTTATVFPERGVILLQVPVTKGTTYTFTTMCSRFYTGNLYLDPAPEIQFGSLSTNGGLTTITSTINAYLVTTN